MPVKQAVEQDAKAKEGEEVLRKRVSRRVLEADFVYQGVVWERGSSKKQMTKGRRSHDPFPHSLVKFELDAAQALADFSRLVHMPSKHPSLNDLKWSAKRRRSIRSFEAPGAKVGSSNSRSELNSMASLLHGDKASPPLDSRAESPSSPLPASKLESRSFLSSGDHSSKKSAFQRVFRAEPTQKPSLTSIKLEMEELQSETLPLARHPWKSKGPLTLCSVKTGWLDEQEEGCMHVKNAGAMVLANLASQIVELTHEVGRPVSNKPKSGLSKDDKEARRLCRIQANRESARYTIRKKQILCEELRRQAASLASENEAMKQKKKSLTQELLFLKGQNHHLKIELEAGLSCKLEPGVLQHFQGIPVTLSAWQVPSLPYTGFPSHSAALPRMMTQGGVVRSEERLRNLASNQCMDPLNTGLMVPGILVSSPMFENGVMGNDMSSLVPTSSPKEESEAGGTETLKSSGASCDVDSAISNAPHGSEREVEERGMTLCRPTALLPSRSDNTALRETQQSKSRGSENTDKNHSGLPLALPVNWGSSCMGNMPLNGLGHADVYAWRMTQRTAAVAAAAEARKKRMELSRKKRACRRRLKVGV